ncbi:hypothetical protein DVH05_002946 [Phytophthora capsici]|nr:hypothetical protein DVH05_002946 [Phytophthora capsici]
MTAAVAKAAYGSATKKECKKCDRVIYHTNIYKHVKVCKGIKLHETSSEIRKKSWERNQINQRQLGSPKVFKVAFDGSEMHIARKTSKKVVASADLIDKLYCPTVLRIRRPRF